MLLKHLCSEKVSFACRTSPLNGKWYWSLAALVVIDKTEYLPLRRNCIIQLSPNTSIQLHGWEIDELGGLNIFLPFEQADFIADTTKFQHKLQNRAVSANYLRYLSKDTYQVYKREKKRITAIRQSEFCLRFEKLANASDKPSEAATRISRPMAAKPPAVISICV